MTRYTRHNKVRLWAYFAARQEELWKWPTSFPQPLGVAEAARLADIQPGEHIPELPPSEILRPLVPEWQHGIDRTFRAFMAAIIDAGHGKFTALVAAQCCTATGCCHQSFGFDWRQYDQRRQWLDELRCWLGAEAQAPSSSRESGGRE